MSPENLAVHLEHQPVACQVRTCDEAAVHQCGQDSIDQALGCGQSFCDAHIRGARHGCPRDPELAAHADDGNGTCTKCAEPYPCFHAERRVFLLGA